jgi:hypothetical protein
LLTELDHEEAELVMNACTPRGHYFFAVRHQSALAAVDSPHPPRVRDSEFEGFLKRAPARSSRAGP